ncbi:hypothetical protein [Bacteroides acidifaciens]|uniref:hypothetical protein n=1 Tax=Bacteroides acidifaciens TaxID=85831 RepID=UPI0025B578B1|nr:hypothetical protein [Bacteroides acidifaciens]
MAIQDEMYKLIVEELNSTVEAGKEKVLVDTKKAKEVVKMLTSLCTDRGDASTLVNQYISQIKIICNS